MTEGIFSPQPVIMVESDQIVTERKSNYASTRSLCDTHLQL